MINILRKLKNLLETNPTLSRLFDKLAGTKIYRSFVYSKIKLYTEKVKKTKRYNVIIETSNICNARCVMCPHIVMQRKMEIMNDEVFDKIIERLKEEKINPLVFILNGFGDPLTDNNIFLRIKKLKENFPDSILKFYSNLGLANDERIENLVECGLDEINISFNGYNEKNYEETMKISYSRTLSNLRKLIVVRNEKKSSLKIRLSMTLVSTNEGDEKKFIKEWNGKVDSVSVNKVHTYNNSVEDVSGKNKINYNKLTYPCKYLWNTIVIGVTGDLFLCCLDYEGSYNFGNIENDKILELFYSESFEKIRKQHLDNNIKNIKMCSTCYTPYKNGVEWLVDNLY